MRCMETFIIRQVSTFLVNKLISAFLDFFNKSLKKVNELSNIQDNIKKINLIRSDFLMSNLLNSLP
ncbi:hypothetical protein BpHYR1_033666 [Brachionus plicatilis]|uniref:Uncharacterized protein n=1 Tax=Brachionus plicatilis TaxID=10195 RepID=A0A3M7QQT2_BRAPC|nr:hypothetical protein BpHYR1_033666 [Brachionus plicatilis]